MAVNPGETNPEQIRGMPGEDKVPGEDVVYYDIRFFAYRPDKKEKVKIPINVEAQKDFWLGYRIETRGDLLREPDDLRTAWNRVFHTEL